MGVVSEVVCDNIQFLESKSNNNQNTQNKHNNQGYARNQQTRQNVTSNIDSLQLNNELIIQGTISILFLHNKI